jgi:two-component system, NarL family, nitrate/nitrite response regulator NarL
LSPNPADQSLALGTLVNGETMNRSVRKSPAERPTGAEHANEIQRLLAHLVRRITGFAASTKTRTFYGRSDEVILDTDIDGVRCLFVRKARKPDEQQVVISPRERAIARLVAAGYPNKTIAASLRISTWTVSTHLRRIFAKLGVSSRAAMVAHLMERGVLSEHLDEPGAHNP